MRARPTSPRPPAPEHGLWWSPCGQFLAVTEVDESHIPVYHILHQGKDGVTEDMMV